MTDILAIGSFTIGVLGAVYMFLSFRTVPEEMTWRDAYIREATREHYRMDAR